MSRREMRALAKESGALVDLDANTRPGGRPRARKAPQTDGECTCGSGHRVHKSRKFPSVNPRDALVNSVSSALDTLGIAAKGVVQHDAQREVQRAQDTAMPQCKALCALAKTGNEALALMFGAELWDVGTTPKKTHSPHWVGSSPSSKRRRAGQSPLHPAPTPSRSTRTHGSPSAAAEVVRASPAKSPAGAQTADDAEPWRKAWPAPSLNSRQCARLYCEYTAYCTSGDYGRFVKRGGSAKHRWMPLQQQVQLCIALGLSMTRGHERLYNMWQQYRANCCNADA